MNEPRIEIEPIEKEYLISYKDGGFDHNTEILACSREEALRKFYNQMEKGEFIWDVVCW